MALWKPSEVGEPHQCCKKINDMVAVFLDFQGMVHSGCFPERKAVNKAY